MCVADPRLAQAAWKLRASNVRKLWISPAGKYNACPEQSVDS